MSGTVYWTYPILPFGIVPCTFFPTTFLEIAVYGSTYPPSHGVIPYALTILSDTLKFCKQSAVNLTSLTYKSAATLQCAIDCSVNYIIFSHWFHLKCSNWRKSLITSNLQRPWKQYKKLPLSEQAWAGQISPFGLYMNGSDEFSAKITKRSVWILVLTYVEWQNKHKS